MTTLNKSDLQKFSEQSGLQVDGRSEFAYTDRLEHFSRLVRLDLELEIDDLKDQLAKAEQLWQIAQGRCDGLEEKLATAQAEIKRMEERRCEICGYAEHHREHTGCLRVKVKELTAERDALKQQRDDLLVAQQWQPINTAPKEGLFLVHRKHTAYPIVAHVYKPYGSICDYVFGELLHNVTHWMPLPKAPTMQEDKP